jgi:hypothetical protein
MVFGWKKPLPFKAFADPEQSETAHAPAARTPYAPPALTFGLPGKQKVKFVNEERFLPSAVRQL